MEAPLGYLRLGSVLVYQVQLMVNSCSGAKRYTCRNVVKEDWIWISLDREFFFRGESYCGWGIVEDVSLKDEKQIQVLYRHKY